ISILPWVFGAVIVLLTGWISQLLMARGVSTRGARGVLGAVPLIVGGLIFAVIPYVDGAGLQTALLVIGSGLCGSIYVVCAPMLGEFTPVIQRASGVLVGFMTCFTINAVILIVSGLLGLLLLWPDTERARLMGEAPQP